MANLTKIEAALLDVLTKTKSELSIIDMIPLLPNGFFHTFSELSESLYALIKLKLIARRTDKSFRSFYSIVSPKIITEVIIHEED